MFAITYLRYLVRYPIPLTLPRQRPHRTWLPYRFLLQRDDIPRLTPLPAPGLLPRIVAARSQIPSPTPIGDVHYPRIDSRFQTHLLRCDLGSVRDGYYRSTLAPPCYIYHYL